MAAAELAPVLAVMDALHNVSITWYSTLNNSSSTRPNLHGGRSVESMGKLRAYAQAASDGWTCTLQLPYDTHTGRLQLAAVGVGNK